MLFDSHAHLDDERFDSDRQALIESLPGRGISYVVNVGADMESSRRSIELSEQYPFIYAAVGVHPHEASGCSENTLDEIKALAGKEKVVAIGEIGLDYHYDFSPRDVQKEVFAKQIALARELNLPIIVHDRESHRDVLDILKSERAYETGGVLHCFSGSVEMAREAFELGFKIGIGGAVTFKNARKSIEVVQFAPLDMLLVETDCPYMTPEPYRGRRNWSGYIKLILQKMAEIKGIDYSEIEEATTNNAKRLFRV